MNLLENLTNAVQGIAESFGETVTFSRGGSFQVVIRRDQLATAGKTGSVKGAISYLPSDTSVIDCPLSLMPVAGESFTEGKGKQHRVQKVQRLGVVNRCFCQTSQ